MALRGLLMVKIIRCLFLIAAALVIGPSLAFGAAPPDSISGTSVLSRGDLRALVALLSKEEGLDPRLVDALITAESDYNPLAVSKKGAMGLMQLMPTTARRLSVEDPFDPEQNVRGGVREFSRLIDRYSGNISLALAAYNAGETAVAKYGGIPPYRETRTYVARIMEQYMGRPYRLGIYRVKRVPVRLHGDLRSGTAVISNVGSAVSSAHAGSLGGGFGR